MKNSQEIEQESSINETFSSDRVTVTLGDIFLLGEHTLLCSDARDIKSV